MTSTEMKPRLIYSLSTRPPIPFPLHPSYPIRLPTRDLKLAYFDSLWTSRQPDQISLESFARLLLAFRAQEPPDELHNLLRSLLRPLHDFDRRWRNTVPELLEEEEEEEGDGRDTTGKNLDTFDLTEKAMLFEAYERWEVEESKRVEEEKVKRVAKGKEKAIDQDAMDQDEREERDEDENDEVRPETWITDREVYETRLQALLLLTLLSLPSPTAQSTAPKKGKGRKKKDPERDATTLDPALLLDFLTDRLQIWRVMQGISLDEETDGREQDRKEVVEKRDTVQEWWADIVEPLFRPHLPPDTLSHHRTKLFPDAMTDSGSTSMAAFYEERSLMSLDKSARRRELRESQSMVAESPTMKRLMSMPLIGKEGDSDVFKVPLPPTRRTSSGTSLSNKDEGSSNAADGQSTDSTTRTRLPRKQDRPRPLPRGDSATANMRDMLKRREVSLAKKASSTGITKKSDSKKDGIGNEIGRKRKRKSASPQKLTTSSRQPETLTLVPDTPAKPTSKAPSFKKPFSRAVSLPSFAALGAAFRPGAFDSASLPFGVPPPPILPGDRSREMDWEPVDERNGGDQGGSDEEDWLRSRREDWQAKGGRQRHTSGSTEDDEMDNRPSTTTALETPKKKAREILVPDT